MLLAPNGLTIQAKTILPLSREQIGWFGSGAALLAHLDQLATIGVVPYCAICAHAGHKDAVQAVLDGGRGMWVVGSACRRGELTVEKARTLSVAELLANLGWRLRCGNRCEPPMDGVEGNNDPAGSTFTVTCGCTDRIYAPEVGHA